MLSRPLAARGDFEKLKPLKRNEKCQTAECQDCNSGTNFSRPMSDKIINGTWQSFRGDFIVKYQGNRRFASIAYQDKVGKKGMIGASIWLDGNRNGVRESGEQVLATLKAKAEVVAWEINYYSKESGRFEANKKERTFKLSYDGDVFATGSILSQDFFF